MYVGPPDERFLPSLSKIGVPVSRFAVPCDMEMVPNGVAEAGRAVKELGIANVKSLLDGNTVTLLKALKYANYRKGMLEQQLIKAGIAVVDDIPYEEAKENIISLGKHLLEIGGARCRAP
jgi:hypothetical protein